jgi:hypothetical protein
VGKIPELYMCQFSTESCGIKTYSALLLCLNNKKEDFEFFKFDPKLDGIETWIQHATCSARDEPQYTSLRFVVHVGLRDKGVKKLSGERITKTSSLTG